MDAPEPFVPADRDVRDLDGFMLNVERLLASELVAVGKPEECWYAFMLWCRSWKQLPGGSLPNNDRILAGFCGAGPRWAKVRETAMHGWVLCSDGRYYHRVVCAEVERAYQRKIQYQTRRDADRKRLSEWRKKHSGNGDETCFVAEDTGQGQGQGHIEERAEAIASVSAPPPKPKEAKHAGRKRLPADWQPDEQDCRHAEGRGHDGWWIGERAEEFRDHHTAKQTLSADWHASWRTWVRNAERFAERDSRGVALNGTGRVARSGSLAAAASNLMSQLDMEHGER